MVQLGQKVRDAVSGYEGIVTARTEWLNGCVRITVHPRVAKEKSGAQTLADGQVFDEEQLEIVTAKPLALPSHKTPPAPLKAVRTGGDRPATGQRR